MPRLCSVPAPRRAPSTRTPVLPPLRAAAPGMQTEEEGSWEDGRASRKGAGRAEESPGGGHVTSRTQPQTSR